MKAPPDKIAKLEAEMADLKNQLQSIDDRAESSGRKGLEGCLFLRKGLSHQGGNRGKEPDQILVASGPDSDSGV